MLLDYVITKQSMTLASMLVDMHPIASPLCARQLVLCTRQEISPRYIDIDDTQSTTYASYETPHRHTRSEMHAESEQ